MVETAIASFLIRFTQDYEIESQNHAWRGYIRHVQSKDQVNFTYIQEALDFMSQVVDLDGAEVNLIRNLK